MNKEFKDIIFNYLDRNYTVDDNVLYGPEGPNAYHSLAKVMAELHDIFGLSSLELHTIFKGWIEAKLTTKDKIFFIKENRVGGHNTDTYWMYQYADVLICGIQPYSVTNVYLKNE